MTKWNIPAILRHIENIKRELQTSFQVGVDTIYNAVVLRGVTPTSKTPAAIATAIGEIPSGIEPTIVFEDGAPELTWVSDASEHGIATLDTENGVYVVEGKAGGVGIEIDFDNVTEFVRVDLTVANAQYTYLNIGSTISYSTSGTGDLKQQLQTTTTTVLFDAKALTGKKYLYFSGGASSEASISKIYYI